MVQDEVCEPGEGVRKLFLVELSPQQARTLQILSHGETAVSVTCMAPSWGGGTEHGSHTVANESPWGALTPLPPCLGHAPNKSESLQVEPRHWDF